MKQTVYRRYAQSGAVDGVVVMGPRLNDWRIELLTELELPFIVHGRAGDNERVMPGLISTIAGHSGKPPNS